MKRIENKKMLLPNIFTVVNMFCGFFAMIESIQGKYIAAIWLIIIAALFDGLDGKIARFTNTKSRFGTEFDSLADLVSFGIAPSILLYTASFKNMGNFGILLTFLPIVCGAFRLGRFNVTSSSVQKNIYLGLPIPVYAAAIASFMIFNFSLWQEVRLVEVLVPLVILLSILMISKVKYEKLPQFKITRNRMNNLKLMFIFASLLVVAYFKELGMFPVVITIIFHGIAKWFIKVLKHQDDTADVSLYE